MILKCCLRVLLQVLAPGQAVSYSFPALPFPFFAIVFGAALLSAYLVTTSCFPLLSSYNGIIPYSSAYPTLVVLFGALSIRIYTSGVVYAHLTESEVLLYHNGYARQPLLYDR